MENGPERNYMMRKAQEGFYEPTDIVKEGDLVRIKNDSSTPEFVPDMVRRALIILQDNNTGGILVWVGPADMSQREVEDFKEDFMGEHFMQESHPGCFVVDGARIERLPDA